MHSLSLEKEKSLIEVHRSEMEKLHSKTKLEFEKLKEKNYQDVQVRTEEYEMKITDLNLK